MYGMTQDLASLDPHVDTDAGTRDVVFNLYEGLVKPTSDGGFIAAVASDYTISDDAKTYTFTLRDGITFHDGTPLPSKMSNIPSIVMRRFRANPPLFFACR